MPRCRDADAAGGLASLVARGRGRLLSDVVGSGLDWSVTTGFPDGDRIALLRGIQRKMPRWRSSFQFTTPEEGQTTVLDAERLEAERRVAPALRAREKRIATHTR